MFFTIHIIGFLLISSLTTSNVNSIKVETLRVHSPVFGMALLADQLNSSSCLDELNELKQAVESRKVWGLKVMDASGRPPQGFLYGNNLWLGSHSQCLDIQNRKQFEIRTEKVNRTETPFDYPPYKLSFATIMMEHNSTLQYHMRLPLDYIIQLGLCVPKSCAKGDIFYLGEQYFSNNTLQFQNEYQVSLKIVNVKILEDSAFWMIALPKTIIFLVLVSIIFIMTIIGTIVDVKQHNREKNLIQGHNNGIFCKDYNKKDVLSPELTTTSTQILTQRYNSSSSNGWTDILKCFSFYSNVKRWATTKISPDSLPILHGLRFLTMVWVILVHNSYFQGDFSQNPPEAWRMSESFMSQIFSNSTYCVDTYLFLSGFLLSYLYYKRETPHDTGKRTNPFMISAKKFVFMLTNRLLRLTPTYVIFILFCNLIYTYYSKSSSLYFSETPEVLCDQYWWRNILYINNLYPRSEMCLSWSWYLSVDMQFFTIGAFILLLSSICFKIAAILAVLVVLVQITATAYKSYSIGYIPTLDDQLEQLDAIYDLPWNRIGPYMIGIMTAYLLRIKLKNKLVLKERTRLILWVVFPLLNLWILFTLYTRQISVAFSAFYMGVSRTLWGVGIAWFTVALSTGNARLLEKLFCYSAWIPLGRLTYCAYLLNPLVVTMIALASETSIVMSVSQSAISGHGTLMITMLISFLFSLLFESPFILLTKVLLARATDQLKTKDSNKPDIDACKETVSVT